ncbi:hypothetical protein RUMHYD_00811 [Blautia hydrogenotrophica DSM 10507]|uniref:Uncharacterized protein n=1 Tax=Blautia hydrogenotrophica (strain DSM 10507 / JCM 14656 / S5a33) TaxID=476272 RepID=C0CIZ4_BLAHS|nr:hypothetical protein RUMHYD_00811 [Blautia hydrogenotrophica DSM 10507]
MSVYAADFSYQLVSASSPYTKRNSHLNNKPVSPMVKLPVSV